MRNGIGPKASIYSLSTFLDMIATKYIFLSKYALQRTTQRRNVLTVPGDMSWCKERARSSVVHACFHVGLSVSTAQQGAALSLTLYDTVRDIQANPISPIVFNASHTLHYSLNQEGRCTDKRKWNLIWCQSLHTLLFFHIEDLMGRAGNLEE